MTEADALFRKLESILLQQVEHKYFTEPREFRSLIQVLDLLNERVERHHDFDSALTDDTTEAIAAQLKVVDDVIEQVVTFQHGGLNHSVDTMADVVKEYKKGRDEIQALRTALAETQSVLTARKSGQTSLRSLWLKKVELQESLRLVRDLEELKNMPLKIQRLMQQKKYYSSVLCLTSALEKMLEEHMLQVGGLTLIRKQLLDMKESMFESIVAELKEVVLGPPPDYLMKEFESESEAEGGSETKSDNLSYLGSALPHGDDTHSIASRPRQNSQQESNYPSPLVGEMNPLSLLKSATLDDVDENVESQVLDISQTGLLYMKLLIKAIVHLHLQEDVERLVVEDLKSSFATLRVARIQELWKLKMSNWFEEQQQQPQAASGEEEAEDYSILSTSSSFIYQTRMFGDYLNNLLETVLLVMQRLFYMNKLLASQVDSRPALLTLWTDLEEVVVRELKVHFVEEELARISDVRQSRRFPATPRGNGDHTEEEEDGEEGGDAEQAAIFKPSAKHAAEGYKRILFYTNKSYKLLKDFNVDELFSAGEVASGQAEGKGKKAATVLQSLQAESQTHNAYQNIMTLLPNRLLEYVQQFLEEELVPIIQSSMNQELREIQLQSQTSFMPLYSAEQLEQRRPCLAAEKMYKCCEELCRYWLRLYQHKNMIMVVLERMIKGLLSAAKEALEPCIYHWYSVEGQLTKEMVKCLGRDAVVAWHKSRLFHGRHSVDELFFPTPQLYPVQANANHSFYASVATASQGTSAKSAMGVSQESLVGDASSARSQASTAAAQQLAAISHHQEFAQLWNASFWELHAQAHPLNAKKIVSDTEALKMLAAVAFASDWLIKKLSTLCNVTKKKAQATSALFSHHTAMNYILAFHGGGASDAAGRRPSGHDKRRSARQEWNDSKQQLTNTFAEALKDLVKFSDECYATLRVEMQLFCFYHFRKMMLAMLSDNNNSNNNNMNNNNNNINNINSNNSYVEDELISSFFTHFQSLYYAFAPHLPTSGCAVILAPLLTLTPKLLSRLLTTLIAKKWLFKARFLRLSVSWQQQWQTLVWQAMAAEVEMRRKLLDLLTENFEKLRKWIAMLEVPMAELKQFVLKHSNDYAIDELRLLYQTATDRSEERGQFELFLQEVGVTVRKK